MKVELKPDEQKQLNSAVESNKVARWLRQKEMMQFEIGDVVLKYHLRTDYQTKKQSWVPENINSDNKMAQRYVYIYQDEFGIGYLKQLRVANGTLGKEIYCLTDYDFNDTKFEVDPEYAERVFLDADFDIKEIHKASLSARKIVTKMNRKIGLKPKTLQEYNDIFEKLKVGDTFWTTTDYTGRYLQEYVLTAITKVTLQTVEKSGGRVLYTWRKWKEKYKGAANSTYLYKISYSGTYSQKDRNILEFDRNVIYISQKPAQEEKK